MFVRVSTAVLKNDDYSYAYKKTEKTSDFTRSSDIGQSFMSTFCTVVIVNEQTI